jgi:hypothetical protein
MSSLDNKRIADNIAGLWADLVKKSQAHDQPSS